MKKCVYEMQFMNYNPFVFCRWYVKTKTVGCCCGKQSIEWREGKSASKIFWHSTTVSTTTKITGGMFWLSQIGRKRLQVLYWVYKGTVWCSVDILSSNRWRSHKVK